VTAKAKLYLARFGILKLDVDAVEQLMRQNLITDRDLVYSAWARCECGAGLAHVRGAAFWCCSAVLSGRMITGGHEGVLPFSDYCIPAEGDASAPGETTRPAKKTKGVTRAAV